MSEKPYRVHKHTDNILDVIKCGNRHVLLITGSSDAYLIAQVLNKEIAPMIEALDEKSLEIMQLNERIAELEAALADATLFGDVNSGEVDFTRLHGQELERYFEARKRHLARKGQQK